MKAIHRKRLLKLADALHAGKIEHKRFNFKGWNLDGDGFQLRVNGCGYAGCAIGQCPSVFPRHWRWLNGVPALRNRSCPWLSGSEFFGLRDVEFNGLFHPYEQGPINLPTLDDDATPKQVAANIRAFVAKKAKE